MKQAKYKPAETQVSTGFYDQTSMRYIFIRYRQKLFSEDCTWNKKKYVTLQA